MGLAPHLVCKTRDTAEWKSCGGFDSYYPSPYLQFADFVIQGATICDAPQKTWEPFVREVPTYFMEIPHVKKESDKAFWLEEVKDYKANTKAVTGKEIHPDSVGEGIRIITTQSDETSELPWCTEYGKNPYLIFVVRFGEN